MLYEHISLDHSSCQAATVPGEVRCGRRMLALTIGLLAATASPAVAQRLPFERTFDVAGAPTIDVSTIRGKIDVSVGEPGRVVVSGAVTVRASWDVPANAIDLARRLAANPPIERDGATIRLRPPSDAADLRAVTINYQVRVPRDTTLVSESDSGATTVRGVGGAVSVRTQSGAIDLSQLGAAATVRTGSGAVTVDGAAGALTVTTSSSAFTGRVLGGDLRVRTGSGAVDAALSGAGDVDIETGSSGIRARGVRGARVAKTRSGRTEIEGAPGKPWDVSTGSGAIAILIRPGTPVTVDAATRSGSVDVDGAAVQGSIEKRRVTGTIGGGPTVRSVSRSGSIRVTVNGDAADGVTDNTIFSCDVRHSPIDARPPQAPPQSPGDQPPAAR
jgi:hypothetical protein